MSDLPRNVFRSSAVAWQEAWPPGMRPPAPFGGETIELYEAFDLKGLGAHLERLDPGVCSAPLHFHHFEEEHFYVLEGTLTVRELPPGAERYREYPLRAGELVAYPGGTGVAHCFFNRSDRPALFFAVSDQRAGEVAEYPDSGKVMLRGVGVGVFGDSRRDVEELLAEAAQVAAARGVDRLEGERPGHVATEARVPERAVGAGVFGRPLARAVGARTVFVNRDRLAPGARTGVLHAHSLEEEMLLVLSGAPTLRQLRGRLEEKRLVWDGASEESVRLRPGDLVHWGPGDGVAHHLLNEGDTDAELLLVGTSRRDDLVHLPEEDRVWSAALERRGTLRRTPYWAGEGAAASLPR